MSAAISQTKLAALLLESKQYTEALNTYSLIVKNKQYAQAGRLRVNMGNIHFEQKKYDLAIKNYNMAIDSTTQQNKEMKLKIKKNVGLALVK